MSIITENPRYSCALGGAVATAKNIYGTIPIIHAGPGCGNQISMGQGSLAGFQGVGYIGGNALPSSNMYEQEVIFGGEDKLNELIGSTLEVVKGDLYFVLTGCTAGIIGDDCESIVNEYISKGYPVIHAATEGFKGSSYYGYEIVFETLANKFLKPLPKNNKTVNIFGIVPYQDVNWQGNLEEITRLLNRLGLKVNSFLINKQGIEAFKTSSEAALNIIISPWIAESLANIYKDKFDIPFIRYPGLPIGPTASSEFLKQAASALNIDNDLVQKVIEEETDYAYTYIEKMSDIYKQFRFAIIGDTNTVIGLTNFLINDYGQIPTVAIITDEPKEEYRDDIIKELSSFEFAYPPKVVFSDDRYIISTEIEKAEPSFIFGSSLDKEIAQTLGIPHLSVSFPITDRLILNHAFAGFRGSITFIEDIFRG